MKARRRRLSLAFWIPFALLLAGLATAAWWVDRRAEAYLRARVTEELTKRLGAQVTIDRLEVELLPPAVMAREVFVRGEDGTVLAEARAVEIEARWSELRSSPRIIRAVEAEGLEIYVERDAEGRFRWLDIDTGGGDGGGVSIERVVVRDGDLHFDDRSLPLDLTLTGFAAQVAGRPADGPAFAGRLDAADAVVELPTGATYAGAVSVRASWADGRLTLVSGRLGGPDLRATLLGGGWEQVSGGWSLDFTAEGSAALLQRLGVTDAEVAGTWAFTGTLAGTEAWSLDGRLTARDFAFEDKTLRNLDAGVRADSEALRLDGIRGRFAQGAVEASVEVAWGQPERPVRVEAKVTRGDIPALMAEFDLEGLDLIGHWSAEGVYTCPASDPMAGQGTFDAEIFAGDRAGRLAWHRRVPLDVVDGAIGFRTLHSDQEAERIAVDGSHDLRTGGGAMQYRADTQQLDAWLDVLGLREDPEVRDWLPASGRGTLQGNLSWAPGDWSTRLEVDLVDVTLGELVASGVHGALSASPTGVRDLRLDFTRPDAALLLSGGIEVGEGPALFDLAVETSGWPAEELARQIELPLEVSGPLVGSIDVAGSSENPEVSARLDVTPATVAGVAAETVHVDVRVADAVAYLEPFEVVTRAGALTIRGSLPLVEGEAALTIDLPGADLGASPFIDWLPEGSGGTVRGSGRLAGALDAPLLELALETEGLRLGTQDLSRAGGSRLELTLAAGELTLAGELGDVLTFQGGGPMTEHDMAVELELTGERLGALLEAFAPGTLAGVDGAFHGIVALTGDPAAEDFAPTVAIDRLTLTYAGKELKALEPIVAAWRGDILEIESFFLGDTATESEIFLSGRVLLAGEPTLDLRGQISLDTVWFEPFLGDLRLEEGTFDALATIEGPLDEPQVNGQGELVQRRIRSPSFDRPIERLNAVVLFYPGVTVLDEAQASFSSGVLRAAGSVVPYAEGGPQYRLQLAAENLLLRYPEGWTVRGGADLNVTSEPGGRVVSGQVKIDSATYTRDVEVGITQLLQGAFARRPELVDEQDEELVATRLNLNVQGPGALRIRNNVADLRGDLDLVVRGNLARPVVFGDVRVEPGGKLLYSGNEYQVRRAALQFANPYEIEPVIDLVATTRLREYDVTLDLSGTLDRLNVNFASNPPLADLEVLSLLAGGEEPRTTELAAAGEAPAASSAQSFLYGQAASAVADRFNRLFGLDKFRIDPLTGESGNISSARVTVGKRLGRDLFATYSYDPSLNELQILQIEWQISRQLTLVATQNGDGSYAVDARWEKSF